MPSCGRAVVSLRGTGGFNSRYLHAEHQARLPAVNDALFYPRDTHYSSAAFPLDFLPILQISEATYTHYPQDL